MKFKTFATILKWIGTIGIGGILTYVLVQVAKIIKEALNPLGEKGKLLFGKNEISAPTKFKQKEEGKPGTLKIIKLTEITRYGSYYRGNLWELEGKEYTVGKDLRDRLEELRREAISTNNSIQIQLVASEDTYNKTDARRIEDMLDSLGLDYTIIYYKG